MAFRPFNVETSVESLFSLTLLTGAVRAPPRRRRVGRDGQGGTYNTHVTRSCVLTTRVRAVGCTYEHEHSPASYIRLKTTCGHV